VLEADAKYESLDVIMPHAREAIMDRTSPTEILEAEHRVIQKVVGAVAVLAEGLGAGQEPPIQTLCSVVEFMRTFADRCHHGKEEAHLFPFLEEPGFRRAVVP